MDVWETKGCEICRGQWLRGDPPHKLGVNYEKHSFLHLCEACGTYWEQFERYVDIVSKENARTEYGDIVINDDDQEN